MIDVHDMKSPYNVKGKVQRPLYKKTCIYLDGGNALALF